MTLIEAIKTGKPIRRKSWGTFLFDPSHYGPGMQRLSLALGDIIADDWIVGEETRELSAAQIKSALMRAWGNFDPWDRSVDFWQQVTLELGFKK